MCISLSFRFHHKRSSTDCWKTKLRILNIVFQESFASPIKPNRSRFKPKVKSQEWRRWLYLTPSITSNGGLSRRHFCQNLLCVSTMWKLGLFTGKSGWWWQWVDVLHHGLDTICALYFPICAIDYPLFKPAARMAIPILNRISLNSSYMRKQGFIVWVQQTNFVTQKDLRWELVMKNRTLMMTVVGSYHLVAVSMFFEQRGINFWLLDWE